MQVMILLESSQGLLIFKRISGIHPGGTISMDGCDDDGDKNGDQC